MHSKTESGSTSCRPPVNWIILQPESGKLRALHAAARKHGDNGRAATFMALGHCFNKGPSMPAMSIMEPFLIAP